MVSGEPSGLTPYTDMISVPGLGPHEYEKIEDYKEILHQKYSL